MASSRSSIECDIARKIDSLSDLHFGAKAKPRGKASRFTVINHFGVGFAPLVCSAASLFPTIG